MSITSQKEISKLISKFEEAIYAGTAAVFCGAGVSKNSGYADWTQLLEPAAQELDLDIKKESDDLIGLAQYFVNSKEGNKQPLLDILDKDLRKNASENSILNLLSKLPIHSFWTTNYDKEIEHYLRQENRNPLVLKNNNDFLKDQYGYTDKVYKFHGDKDTPTEYVITRDDYQVFTSKHPMFTMALSGELTSKTFLFLGYSFKDPDFNDLISTLNILTGENYHKEHYYLDTLKDIESIKDPIEKEEAIYENRKKELAAKDRKRSGILTIWIDSYNQIQNILKRIYSRNITRYISVAGGVRRLPSDWDNEKLTKFQEALGHLLIENDFHVTVGPFTGQEAFVQGVFEEANKRKLNIDDYFLHQEMPRTLENTGNLKVKLNSETQDAYQHKILKNIGIIIFIFGNQTYNNSGLYEPSKGVLHEFERAKKLNKYIIAIPQTDCASFVIFNEIKNNISKYQYLEPFMERLEDNSKLDSSDLAKLIIEIIDYIRDSPSIF